MKEATPAALGVAVSGGRDSMALLHAVAAQAGAFGIEVHALHVHHGLQPQADAWWRHVERACKRWSASRGWPLVFQGTRITVLPQAGESIEAFARRERYAALTRMARGLGIRLVLLAHHRRDQAETFLLQALRGAGPAGLASMPRVADRGGILWVRPWLGQAPAQIESYARRHRVQGVEDPSNRDARYARSRLRAQVMPALESAFDGAAAALAASAERLAEARRALEEAAAADLAACATPEGLHVERWRAISEGRRLNALRAWLDGQLPQVPQTLVERLWVELRPQGRASWPCVGASLRLHRGTLMVVATPDASPRAPIGLEVRTPGDYDVPAWGARLQVRRTRGQGAPLALLGRLVLRPRSGGESFQREAGTPARSLKKQFQDANVPPWLRDGPLLYAGEVLIFVPGLGVDARVLQPAARGRTVVSLQWERAAFPAAQGDGAVLPAG